MSEPDLARFAVFIGLDISGRLNLSMCVLCLVVYLRRFFALCCSVSGCLELQIYLGLCCVFRC